MITVRHSTPDDSLAVATVHVRSWQRAFVGVFPQPLLDALDPVRRAASYTLGPNPDNTTVVAESDRTIVGFATFGPDRSDRRADDGDRIGEVYAIYVDPDRWSSGTGRALMDAAIAEMSNHGYARVVLWTAQGTPQSHRFYERYGFRRDDSDAGVSSFTAGTGTPHQTTVSVVRFGLQLI